MLIQSQNVYWFQGYPAENSQSNTVQQAVFEQLVQIYLEQDPDIIFLQEIQTEAVAKKIASALDREYLYQSGSELTRYGGVCLIKKGIRAKKIHLNVNEKFQRFYQVIQISYLDTDLIICNIHLPSTAQLSFEMANEKRKKEIQAILNANQPIDIICGDFNEDENQNHQVVNILKDHGYLDAIQLNKFNNRSSKLKNKRGDFIFMNQRVLAMAKEFYAIDLTELENHLKNGYILSDHYPLFLRLLNE